MYELKKIGKVFTNKFVRTEPSSYKKRIYLAAVSQMLRNSGLEIVHGRPFLFRIPAKDMIVVFYSTLSPQKCTKLNTEKQNAQGHLGSNLTPESENRNFRRRKKNGYHQQHKTTMPT